MSIAAKRSHRGDDYQLFIALYWITKLLIEDEWEWIQLEAICLPNQDEKVFVDDIVVCHNNGSYRFIQAKKNQPKGRCWSIKDLKYELIKVRDELEKEKLSGIVFFYSQTPFGDFENYLKNARDYERYNVFKINAPQTLKTTLTALSSTINRKDESTFDLFLNVRIGMQLGFDELEQFVKNEFNRITHDPEKAISETEKLLRKNQSGIGTPIRLTKKDIIDTFDKSGLPLSPLLNEENIINNFKEASKIGRENISKEIAGLKIPRSETKDLISCVCENDFKRTAIIGPPGCGKSWILREFADCLESDNQYGLLYIRGDYYDDIKSDIELRNRLYLKDDITGLVARLSSYRKTIIIIDSLDALSISRDQLALKIFLSLIDRISTIENVSIVITCRKFDLEYDPLLRDRKWDKKIFVSDLNFYDQVAPILKKLEIDPCKIQQDQQKLLSNPRNLKLFERLANIVPIKTLKTEYHFTDTYLEKIVRRGKELGDEAYSSIQNMALQLIKNRRLFIHRENFSGSEKILRNLCSEGVVLSDNSGRLTFSHQTLIDALTTKIALAKGQSLEDFILSYPPMPFIRPSIRAFLFYLRTSNGSRFYFQIKKVFENTQIAYHIKRLIAKSLAEIVPTQEDQRLFSWLFNNYPTNFFHCFLEIIEGEVWFDFLSLNIFEQIMTDAKYDNLKSLFIGKLNVWMNKRPKEVIGYWTGALKEDVDVTWQITQSLKDFEKWESNGVFNILSQLLLKVDQHSRRFLGRLISRYIEKTGNGDELLWNFITFNLNKEGNTKLELNEHHSGLFCDLHDFHREDFLKDRMFKSDFLLSKSIQFIDNWDKPKWKNKNDIYNVYLHYTSWSSIHEKINVRSAGPLYILLNSMEYALKERSKNNDSWWQENKKELPNSNEAAIHYILIKAYLANIEDNINNIQNYLSNEKLLVYEEIEFEIRELIKNVFIHLSDNNQEKLQILILNLKSQYEENDEIPSWLLYRKYNYLLMIPNFLRLQEVHNFIEDRKNEYGEWLKPPSVYMKGGTVISPVTIDQMQSLSDKSIIRLFRHYYQNGVRYDIDEFDNLVGGLDDIEMILANCSAIDPNRYIPLFDKFVLENDLKNSSTAILEGISNHIKYRYGNLQPPSKNWQAKEPLPDGKLLTKTIIDWMSKNEFLWGADQGRILARAVEACCHVENDDDVVAVLLSFLNQLSKHHSPDKLKKYHIKPDKKGLDKHDLMTEACNSIRGIAAESSILLAIKSLKRQKALRKNHFPLIQRFARDSHPAVRVSIFRYLPVYAQYDFEGAWNLFHIAFDNPHPLLWPHGENFLYYQYYRNFERVKPYIGRIKQEAILTSGEVFGRISTLCYLSEYIPENHFFHDLATLNNLDVWSGALQVFSANLSDSFTKEKCENGLLYILDNVKNQTIINKFDISFEKLCTKGTEKSLLIAKHFISIFEDAKEISELHWFYDWIEDLSNNDPLSAMEICEQLLFKIESSKSQYPIWRSDKLVNSTIRILREADLSNEENFIKNAISLQDRLLKLNLGNIDKALDEAAR
ncbi:MAG: AAA family ATPase [Candidatus Lokiarchaeota archaeon]|nr:AAA family ATPase [Candidatus Lokiarchaeota archaeon]